MLASGARLTRGGDAGVATGVGPKVQTVLGLSMTSTSFGWVLLDGQGPDAATLDHDAFDIQSAADATAGDTSPHTAAARGAQAIAMASGHKVGSVRVTWSEDVEADATALVKSLADLGFDNVLEIPLSKAVQAWGIEVGRESESTKTGLCILEPDTATVMVVATGAGSVRTAVADTRGTAEDLVDWLRTVFRRDGWLPESLHLVGAFADLDEVTGPIGDALPIPVSDSTDAQMALARGAVLATGSQLDIGSSQAGETPRKDPPRRDWLRRVSPAKELTTAVAAEAVVEESVSQVDTGSSQAAETPPATESTTAVAAEAVVEESVSHVDGGSSQAATVPRIELRKDPPRSERPWLVAHAKKLTISAAGVAVVGAALSLAAGSALNVENVSAQTANTPAVGASETSPSIHTVPAPVSARPAPPVQPLVAGPPPAPPPPPATSALPAEPVTAVAPEPVSIAVPQQTVSAAPAAVPSAPVASQAPVASPPAAHLAGPVPPPGPPPAAPLAAPAVAQPAPVAPPPAAPLAAPPAPIAPPPAVPLGAPPGPLAPPPAAAPVPPAPADPPPPPDPFQAVLSPLFSGLP